MNNGKCYPGANFIEKEDKRKYKIKASEPLKLGYVVYRHPLEGERAFINR